METNLLDTPPKIAQPTPDPTRSGALWVGGAGVALLLASAAVLTAVRWDDIGQSVKLGGLVAITCALLSAGQRFKEAVPMTSQAIFHLGALLIPFDVAAVAVLAGRSWQETLLLTSVTSVVAWFPIAGAVGSKVLHWSGWGAVIALAAGVAAVSPIVMPLALALAAAIAVAVRRSLEAATWAVVAGLLPIGAFMLLPPRLANAMLDLGFDTNDRWQPLAAGLFATVVLILVTRIADSYRVETAWSAVAVAGVTALIAGVGFADAQVSYLMGAALFLLIELVALYAKQDLLWKPIVAVLAVLAETVGAALTVAVLCAAVFPASVELGLSPTTVATAGALFGLGWLTADRRRLDARGDWLTGLIIGANWPVTTVLFPAAILAIAPGLSAPAWVSAVVGIALGYWMVATWRDGAVYGAVLLTVGSMAFMSASGHWTQLAIGALGSALLVFAAKYCLRRRDEVGAVIAATVAAVAWLGSGMEAVRTESGNWPIVVVLLGAWMLSWILEVPQQLSRDQLRQPHPISWIGRGCATAVATTALGVAPATGIALCLSLMALAGVDYLLTRQAGASAYAPSAVTFALIGGAALGLLGAPLSVLVGLPAATTGAVLAVAGFVFVGIGLSLPSAAEVPFVAAAFVASAVGLVMAAAQPSMFAVTLIAIGASTSFAAMALRSLTIGAVGYASVSVGVALQLSIWHVAWLEAYLLLPALAALFIGYRYNRTGGNSWIAYAPTIALSVYVAMAERISGGSAWHAVIAGAVGVAAVIAGGHRRLVGPLITGSAVLAIVVGYESLGPAALVPTWAWLALGGTTLLASGVAMERSDTSPLERGQHIRNVIATQFS